MAHHNRGPKNKYQSEMSFKKIRGIIPPMVTPLLEDNVLDRDGAVRIVEHMIKGGVHAIFLLGTTGEAQSIPSELRYEFVELVCRQVAGRVPVLVAITDTSIDDSLKLAGFAKAQGAAGVVAAAPYYFPMSQEELVCYFSALADRSPLPVYLYNMPSHVKAFLEVPTVVKLAAHPNIAGLKDSSANMNYFRTLYHHLGGREDFALYVGPEELTGECVLMGADGGINGGANMFPELYVSMFNAAEKCDIDKVREIQKRIMAVSTTIYTVGSGSSSYLRGLKCALSQLGLCNGHLALPYRDFDEEHKAKVAMALKNLGC